MADPLYQNLAFAGLGTFTTVIPVAGPYFLKGKISLPTISQGAGPSSCLVTINQNGSPIYTGIAGAEGFYKDFLAAANDTMTVVLTSAAAADQPVNAIKTAISLGSGQ